MVDIGSAAARVLPSVDTFFTAGWLILFLIFAIGIGGAALYFIYFLGKYRDTVLVEAVTGSGLVEYNTRGGEQQEVLLGEYEDSFDGFAGFSFVYLSPGSVDLACYESCSLSPYSEGYCLEKLEKFDEED